MTAYDLVPPADELVGLNVCPQCNRRFTDFGDEEECPYSKGIVRQLGLLPKCDRMEYPKKTKG